MTTSTPAMLANILSPYHLLIILAIIILLFGAKKLPDLAKGLGQSIKEFKKATREIEEDTNETKKIADKTTPPKNDAG